MICCKSRKRANKNWKRSSANERRNSSNTYRFFTIHSLLKLECVGRVANEFMMSSKVKSYADYTHTHTNQSLSFVVRSVNWLIHCKCRNCADNNHTSQQNAKISCTKCRRLMLDVLFCLLLLTRRILLTSKLYHLYVMNWSWTLKLWGVPKSYYLAICQSLSLPLFWRMYTTNYIVCIVFTNGVCVY